MSNCIGSIRKQGAVSCYAVLIATFGPGLMCCAAEADAEKPSW
ncbi:MAG TPA: hypothetical protein VMY06_03400 [Sedimentisphaerales bacterium]|nr:hypothetical protein [Sedimentisphaerales bacterium]